MRHSNGKPSWQTMGRSRPRQTGDNWLSRCSGRTDGTGKYEQARVPLQLLCTSSAGLGTHRPRSLIARRSPINTPDKNGAHLSRDQRGPPLQATIKAFWSDLRLRGSSQHFTRKIIHAVNLLRKQRGKNKYSLTIRWTAGAEALKAMNWPTRRWRPKKRQAVKPRTNTLALLLVGIGLTPH